MPFRPPTSSSIVPPRCAPLRHPSEPVTTVFVKELVRHTGAGRGTWDALEDAPLPEAPMASNRHPCDPVCWSWLKPNDLGILAARS